MSAQEADARHARSCSCGDRVGHELEEGSDWAAPSADELTEFESESLPKVNPLADKIRSRTLARLLTGWADDIR